METSNATPPPPPEKKNPITWPIGLNLALLLVVVAVSGGNVGFVSSSVFGLVIINGLAAFIVSISGSRMHYAIAFLLSCLVLLLIGFGVCAILLSNMGGGH